MLPESQGCVLDPMVACPLPGNAQARRDQQAYLSVRLPSIDPQFSQDSPLNSKGNSDQELLRKLLFQRLATVAIGLLQQQPLTEGTETVYFFNEHYVVKPPSSRVEFRWHRDDEEQLAMCLHNAEIPPYVSAWCALDHINATNGPLRFLSKNHPIHEILDKEAFEVDHEQRAAALDAHGSEPLLVDEGTVVFFRSDVWHCSSANESSTMRRAFYAQYSAFPITSKPRNNQALCFAIPCDILASAPCQHPSRKRGKQPK